MTTGIRRGLPLLASAAVLVSASTAYAVPKALHGEDGRQDLNQVDAETRAFALGSVVAMFNEVYLRETAAGYEYVYPEETFESVYGVCPDERFATQPSWSSCSGVLIDDDLVLTAGHCMQSQYGKLDIVPHRTPCASWRFVFDYAYGENGTLLPIDADDVYGCRGVVAIGSDVPGTLGVRDYAILQLDRPVQGRTPAEVVPTLEPVTRGSGLTLIGFPFGLPMKVATGGRVIDEGLPHYPFFVSDVDTFIGNSGSPVLDEQMRVVGILVLGMHSNTTWGPACYTVTRVPSAQAGEEATYARLAVDHLCDRGYPSERLCGIAPSCGDLVCTAGETTACASDCVTTPRCGDFLCDVTELGRFAPLCAIDCVAPASEYRSRYHTPDGCSASPSASSTRAPLCVLAALALFFARRRRTHAGFVAVLVVAFALPSTSSAQKMQRDHGLRVVIEPGAFEVGVVRIVDPTGVASATRRRSLSASTRIAFDYAFSRRLAVNVGYFHSRLHMQDSSADAHMFELGTRFRVPFENAPRLDVYFGPTLALGLAGERYDGDTGLRFVPGARMGVSWQCANVVDVYLDVFFHHTVLGEVTYTWVEYNAPEYGVHPAHPPTLRSSSFGFAVGLAFGTKRREALDSPAVAQ